MIAFQVPALRLVAKLPSCREIMVNLDPFRAFQQAFVDQPFHLTTPWPDVLLLIRISGAGQQMQEVMAGTTSNSSSVGGQRRQAFLLRFSFCLRL